MSYSLISCGYSLPFIMFLILNGIGEDLSVFVTFTGTSLGDLFDSEITEFR